MSWSNQQRRTGLPVSGEVEEVALLAKTGKAGPAFGFGRTEQGDNPATNPVSQGPPPSRKFRCSAQFGGAQMR